MREAGSKNLGAGVYIRPSGYEAEGPLGCDFPRQIIATLAARHSYLLFAPPSAHHTELLLPASIRIHVRMKRH